MRPNTHFGFAMTHPTESGIAYLPVTAPDIDAAQKMALSLAPSNWMILMAPLNALTMPSEFVIHSPSRQLEAGNGCFWNKDLGWVDVKTATILSAAEFFDYAGGPRETDDQVFFSKRDALADSQDGDLPLDSWLRTIKPDDRVWWCDPDMEFASGYYTVDAILVEGGIVDSDDSLIYLRNEAGSNAEVFAHELRQHKPVADGSL